MMQHFGLPLIGAYGAGPSHHGHSSGSGSRVNIKGVEFFMCTMGAFATEFQSAQPEPPEMCCRCCAAKDCEKGDYYKSRRKGRKMANLGKQTIIYTCAVCDANGQPQPKTKTACTYECACAHVDREHAGHAAAHAELTGMVSERAMANIHVLIISGKVFSNKISCSFLQIFGSSFILFSMLPCSLECSKLHVELSYMYNSLDRMWIFM